MELIKPIFNRKILVTSSVFFIDSICNCIFEKRKMRKICVFLYNKNKRNTGIIVLIEKYRDFFKIPSMWIYMRMRMKENVFRGGD